jgi:hypothetical protein
MAQRDPIKALHKVLAAAGNLVTIVHEYLPPLPKGWSRADPYAKLRRAARVYDDAIVRAQKIKK